MNRRKHNDGPWIIHGQAIVSETSNARAYNPKEAADYGGMLVCESVRPENRQIIAEAPEMLKILEQLVDYDSNAAISVAKEWAQSVISRIRAAERDMLWAEKVDADSAEAGRVRLMAAIEKHEEGK